MFEGNSMDSLFVINDCKTKRVSSYDKTGGNRDWVTINSGEEMVIADIKECAIIRHIWCTTWVDDGNFGNEKHYLRKLVLRMYWDDCAYPSVEVPLGDFFGLGFGINKSYFCEAFSVNPQDGRSLNCYFPMPFRKNAKITIENGCEGTCFFYYYIDYETHTSLEENVGYFHAVWKRKLSTEGWAPKEENLLEKEKANEAGFPSWYPAAWLKTNTTGKDNYVVLDAKGKGKYVGCNLSIDVFERQANDWYGEGDDMIFIDGEEWPSSLHGTGTEDYFNSAFCPTQVHATPYSGITLYSGEEAGFRFGGKNSMYRLHIRDPIYFNESILVTFETGHANKLSNDYASTAYWYQTTQHEKFEPLPSAALRIPREHRWES